jgi:hypothetical protein
MRLLPVAALAVVLTATPAAAQLSNHGIAVESGLSGAAGGRGAPAPAFALSASTWLEGDVDAFARIAYASAAETVGRAAVPALTGTVGLRLSLGHAPLRPQVFVDAGWARIPVGGGLVADRGALGAGVALEWFPAGDFSVAPRAAIRTTGAEPVLELGLVVGGYF